MIKHRQTSWKADRFVHFSKGSLWYTLFSIVMILIFVGAIYYKQWLLAGVIAVGMFAIFSFAKERPAERQYRIDQNGVQIGRKTYRYEDLKSFWLVSTPETNLLYLQTTNKFMPPEMINIGAHDPVQVRAVLRNHIPEEQKSELLLDRINRWIRF